MGKTALLAKCWDEAKKGNYPVKSARLEQTVPRSAVFFDQLRQEMSGIQGLDDRGATPYFHGRKRILKRFEDLLTKSEETSGESTFIVQGPPGIGKTTLLAECWMKAAEAGWHVAEIDPDDLWDADKLQETLGLPPEKRTVPHTVEGGGDAGFKPGQGGSKTQKNIRG